jgi:hypothetical protein
MSATRVFSKLATLRDVPDSGDLVAGDTYVWNGTSFDRLSADAADGYPRLDDDGHLVGTFIVRTDTAANLASVVLASGELALRSDTGIVVRGDGSTAGGVQFGVGLTGDQTIAGAKTFSDTTTVPTLLATTISTAHFSSQNEITAESSTIGSDSSLGSSLWYTSTDAGDVLVVSNTTSGNVFVVDDAGNLTLSGAITASGASLTGIPESAVTNLTTDLAAKLAKTSNLSDLASAATARTNLGLIKTATFVFSAVAGLVTNGWQAPVAGTILDWTVLADASATCSIDITKSSYANFPGSLTSIVASAAPALSSAQKNTSSTLTGWTTSVAQGDVMRATLSSVSGSATKITLKVRIAL